MVASERQSVGAEMGVSPIKERSPATIFAPPAKVNNVGPKKGATKLPPSVQREKNRIDSLARPPPNTERPPSWISQMAGSVNNAIAGTLGGYKVKETHEDKESNENKPEHSWVYAVCFQLKPNPAKELTLIEPDYEIGTQDMDEVASKVSIQCDVVELPEPELQATAPVTESSLSWFRFPPIWKKKEQADYEENDDVESPTIRILNFSPLSIDKTGSFFWELHYDGDIIDEQTCKIARFLGWNDEHDDSDEYDDEEYIAKGVVHEVE